MGVTAISIGVGALVPKLNLVAKPFVCPGGAIYGLLLFLIILPGLVLFSQSRALSHWWAVHSSR